MSGEYFCIEGVGERSNYRNECNLKTSGPLNLDTEHRYVAGDHDSHSTSTKKSQDCQLLDIEEQLELAESRCNTLKGQLDSMKKNYRKISPREGENLNKSHGPTLKIKNQRKRSISTQPLHSHVTPSCMASKNPPELGIYDGSIADIPQNSNLFSAMHNDASASTNLRHPPLLRQNSTSIGTDHTGASAKTINNILSGITTSVNKLTQLHSRSNDDYQFNYLEKPQSNVIGVTCGMPGKPFSPRLKKRHHEQQKRVEKIVKEAHDVKAPNCDKKSSTSMKSKSRETALEKWTRQVTNQLKNKAQCSLGNINIPKHIKSNIKHAENTTKLKPVRTGMLDEDFQNILRKRKRPIKRLKTASKLSLMRKPSDSDPFKRIIKFSTDNLVELYHNVAAKSSDSDDDAQLTRSQLHTRQGEGDIPTTCGSIVPNSYNATHPEGPCKKPASRMAQSPRILTPIEENMQMENSIVRRDYFNHIPRNYEMPTIASKLKRVTKNYLRSFNYFNFRCIPFCAAKSTSPSHNIGVNIQQVLSIIKGRQSITGISPTLAHNISLAAEKLQGSPLSAFVSNLSTRIGAGYSRCPLLKHNMNYHKLQEMAKAIPEEPYEEGQAELTEVIFDDVPHTQASLKNELAPPVPPIWTSADSVSRCTCITQRGVPFQQVLSKYQVSSSDTIQTTIKAPPKIQTKQSNQRPFYGGNKQRTAAWVSTSSNRENIFEEKQNEQKEHQELQQNEHQELRGKEKNLKAVLKNLHDEFDSLNTKYENLSKSNSNASPESLKQLEEMENQLNQKEEEINMVMSLCTEVMALKDQVKKLRDRTSYETILDSRTMDKKEPKTALHLTQLLRQIQNYQNRCQNKV